MQINKHYVLGLALSLTLVACGKDEKTKTVTVENPKTQQELVEAKQKRDELQALVDNAPDATQLQADLDAAKGEVTTLTGQLNAKTDELSAKEAELETARATGGNVKALEDEVALLKKEKGDLQTKVDAAKIFEENAVIAKANFEKLLVFAIENKATNDAGQTLKDKFTAKLKEISKAVTEQETKVKLLNEQIAAQSIEVGKAETARTTLLKSLYDEHEELSKIAESARTPEQKARFAALEEFVNAGKAAEKAKAARDEFSKKIEEINGKIKTLDDTIAKDEKKLVELNAELVTLARAGNILTPRGIELTKVIPDLTATITKNVKDRAELKAESVNKGEGKAAKIAEIEANVTTQAKFFDPQQEAADLAVKNAQGELNILTAALSTAEGLIKTRNEEQTSVKALQKFYDELNLAPVGA